MPGPHLDNAGPGAAMLPSYSDGAGSAAAAAAWSTSSCLPSPLNCFRLNAAASGLDRCAGAPSSLPSVLLAQSARCRGPTSSSPS
eukprot:4384604-Alexandrium_andersonii.AAC.1